MIDWTASMQQTFEFYTVNPYTWGDIEMLDNITSCSIVRDETDETLSYATFDCTSELGEQYIRVYLKAVQNRESFRLPLGTYLCQTPGSGFDGRVKSVSADAYSPLMELKEKNPPVGYYISVGQNLLKYVSTICREQMRGPITESSDETVVPFNFVSETGDSWLTYLSSLLSYGHYRFGLDDDCRVIFLPYRDVTSMQPIWTYTDDNSSILYPEIETNRDLYGLPNVVEIIYSDNSHILHSKVVNDDPNSPISTVARGREIIHREVNPEIRGGLNQISLDEYAKKRLKELSSLEYTLTYSHGYCPVRVGDCVLLNYRAAGFENVKARVTRQSIKCESSCQVEETAVYTENLWG